VAVFTAIWVEPWSIRFIPKGLVLLWDEAYFVLLFGGIKND
jgi:hypothetical protein